MKIIATNDSGKTGSYSDATEVTAAITSGLVQSSSISSVNLGFNTTSSSAFCTGTIYRVGSTTAITNLVKYNNTLKSSTFTIPIHTTNIGSTGSNIMTLTSALSGTVGPTVYYSGFPIGPTGPTTSNNITITTDSIVDKYSTSNAYNQGFYLNANNYVTINPSAYISPSNTLTLTQNFNDGSSGATSYTFYYDSQLNSTGPTGGISSITLPGSTYVSGIKVVDGNSSSININTILTNMGIYFYKSTLIDYSIKNNTTTLATSSITSIPSTSISNTKIITDSIEGKISFTNGVSINTSTFYKNITISGTGYNPQTSTTIPSVTLTNLIIDKPSVSLLSMIPTTIPNVAGSSVVGCRIWSAPSISGKKYTNLNYTNANNSKTYNYYDIKYNHAWNIASNTGTIESTNDTIDPSTELQVCNGYFRTKAASDGYMDYSLTSTVTITNNYNNPNYSSIINSNYRYATFAWKLTPISSSYTKLTFEIPFINSSTTIATNSEGLLFINGTALDIYYMFQDASSSSYDSTIFNSVWINANSVTNPEANTSNFYILDNNGSLYGTSSSTYSNNSATFNVFIPNTIFPVNNTTYLYCRIGLPMNVNTWFNYISAKVS